MRIIVVTGPFGPLPPVGCGAVETLWARLAKEFSVRGHEVTVFCRGHDEQCPQEVIDGVHYLRRFRFVRSGSLTIDLLKDLVYSIGILMLLPVADIIVTNAFWLPVLLPRIRKGAGKTVVNVARMPKGQLFLYSRVARLAAVSQAVLSAIATEAPKLSARSVVVPNPIETDVFRPDALPRDWGRSLVVLYTGRIHPEKGLSILINAFREVYKTSSKLTLRIVGPWRRDEGGGGFAYLDELKELASGLPVSFGDPIYDKKALASELNSAHIYCYPSVAEKGESFGVAPLEAMGTGLAPIVSDLPCFRDFIQDGENGLIFNHRTSHASADLARCLSIAIKNHDLMDSMGVRAATTARQYSYSKVADLYLTDFEKLLRKT